MNYPQQGYQQPAQQNQFQQPQVPQPQFQQPQFPQYTQPYPAPQGQPGPRPPVQQAPQAQAPQPVRGTLASGWDQGARSQAYGAWVKFPNEGYVFEGFVARDMVDGDCQQVIDPGTKQPKFFPKSQQPQLRFLITFNVQPNGEYPEGKGTLTTDKYKLHQSVVRAMQDQGYQVGEGLREGDYVRIQRIGDVSVGMGRAHEFVTSITRREDLGQAPAQAAPAAQTAPPVEYAAPAAAPVAYATQPGNINTQNWQPQASPDPTQFPTTPVAPVAAPTGDLTANGNRRIPGLDDTQSDMVAQYGAAQPQS